MPSSTLSRTIALLVAVPVLTLASPQIGVPATANPCSVRDAYLNAEKLAKVHEHEYAVLVSSPETYYQRYRAQAGLTGTDDSALPTDPFLSDVMTITPGVVRRSIRSIDVALGKIHALEESEAPGSAERRERHRQYVAMLAFRANLVKWLKYREARDQAEAKVQQLQPGYNAAIQSKDGALEQARTEFNTLQAWIAQQSASLAGRPHDAAFWSQVAELKRRADATYNHIEALLTPDTCFGDVAGVLADIKQRHAKVLAITIPSAATQPPVVSGNPGGSAGPHFTLAGPPQLLGGAQMSEAGWSAQLGPLSVTENYSGTPAYNVPMMLKASWEAPPPRLVPGQSVTLRCRSEATIPPPAARSVGVTCGWDARGVDDPSSHPGFAGVTRDGVVRSADGTFTFRVPSGYPNAEIKIWTSGGGYLWRCCPATYTYAWTGR